MASELVGLDLPSWRRSKDVRSGVRGESGRSFIGGEPRGGRSVVELRDSFGVIPLEIGPRVGLETKAVLVSASTSVIDSARARR